MELSDTSGSRFEFLLSQFRAGEPITHGRLALALLADELQCAVGSRMETRTVTEARARDILRRARHELEALLAEVPALAAAVEGRRVRYVLVEGMMERWDNGPELAEQVGDDFRWCSAVNPLRHLNPPVQAARPLRHLTRSELRRRFAELRTLLSEWTRPRGRGQQILYEYDSLVGPILRYLEAGESPSTIAEFLRGELSIESIDRLATSPERFAERVCAWYATHWPNTDSVPSGR